MKIEIELPDYDGNAMDVIWDNDAKYVADVNEHGIIIKADSRGLMSLAKQMIYMAVNPLPNGAHVHYDSFFTQLAQQKYELIIEKEGHEGQVNCFTDPFKTAPIGHN